jgi:basic membrane protein A
VKRKFFFAGALVLSLVAAGCGDDGDDSSTAAESGGGAGKPKLAVIYSGPFKDGSWAEQGQKAAEKLKKDGAVSEIKLQDGVKEGADAQRVLESLATDGWNPIIAHSFNYGDDVKAVAKKFPKTLFLYAGGFGDIKENVGDYSQPFHESAYLEGILAAGATKSGKTAGAGGFDIPVCKAMSNAFTEGAKLVRPDTTGSFLAVGDWEDVQKAKEATLGQASGGATMFIGCGQGPTYGGIETAKDKGGVAFGYVGDMNARADSVVASMMWQLDKPWKMAVEDAAAGKTVARYYDAGTKDGALEIIISPKWKDKISADAMKLFDAKLADIKSGKLTVPFNDK